MHACAMMRQEAESSHLRTTDTVCVSCLIAHMQRPMLLYHMHWRVKRAMRLDPIQLGHTLLDGLGFQE
jgi:hypothetical protein